ncbi:hypothetical protein PIB30_004091 [Stylosanthes scabra]|uniref:Uncharacterized protein n=1 Tax=Stylosanthes scabra TaxID=79078 RepID=A0ABU6Z1C7_9FABA|nr:hypothetical protein [Stylosanthes scabra]
MDTGHTVSGPIFTVFVSASERRTLMDTEFRRMNTSCCASFRFVGNPKLHSGVAWEARDNSILRSATIKAAASSTTTVATGTTSPFVLHSIANELILLLSHH